MDRDLLDEALEDLIVRVDDWKNHRVDSFGRLLLHGMYSVVTGRNDQEKFVRLPQRPSLSASKVTNWEQYEIYLFECILLCCKEVVPNKSKDKKDKTKSTIPKVRNKNNKLQLKGRIFMTNVTEVLSFAGKGKLSPMLSSILVFRLIVLGFRLIYRSNMVERRPRCGKLRYQIQ